MARNWLPGDSWVCKLKLTVSGAPMAEGKLAEPEDALDSLRMLDRLQSFLLDELLLGDTVRTFFDKWAHEFAGADAGGEQQLSHMAAYREYQAALESILVRFLEHAAVSMSAFRDMCEDLLDRGVDAEARTFVEQMLAVLEYPVFVQMMSARAAHASKRAGK